MKNILISSCLALALGAGLVVGYHEIFKDNHIETTALSPIFKNKKSLYEKTDIIVEASVPSKYTEVEAELPDEEGLFEVSRVYEVTIEKTIKNKNGDKLKKGDVIEFYIPVALKQKKSGKTLPLVEEEKIQIEEGEYLLFLENENSEIYHKEILRLKTPNHLYKKDNGTYENIGSSFLPELEEEDLANIDE